MKNLFLPKTRRCIDPSKPFKRDKSVIYITKKLALISMHDLKDISWKAFYRPHGVEE